MVSANNIILEIKGLKTNFTTDEGIFPAVDGVNFKIHRGETLGLVGESGSGKSVTALSIMRLVPTPPGKITAGAIYFNGANLLTHSPSQMRKIRGNKISMIFQEPMTSLNPVFTIGKQISTIFKLHQKMNNKTALTRSIEMLDLVGIPSAAERIHDYPHQLSGGMRQRVMIAMALSCNPNLLIADEPTTALDVTIQAQILDLMAQLKAELGTAILLITHDLGVVAENASRVVVMYAGKVVEEADVYQIFDNPHHPYTAGLMQSIPRLNKDGKHLERLEEIKGMVPNLSRLPLGCHFNPRCTKTLDICYQKMPEIREIQSEHRVRCWLYD